MGRVYTAKPAAIVEDPFVPPGWDPIWPWAPDAPHPPGYSDDPTMFSHDPDDPIPPTFRITCSVEQGSDLGHTAGLIIRRPGTLSRPLSITPAENETPAARADLWNYQSGRYEQQPCNAPGLFYYLKTEDHTFESAGGEFGAEQTEEYAGETSVSELLPGYSYIFTVWWYLYWPYVDEQIVTGTTDRLTFISCLWNPDEWFWLRFDRSVEINREAREFCGLPPDTACEAAYKAAAWEEWYEENGNYIQWPFEDFETVRRDLGPPTFTLTIYKTRYSLDEEGIVVAEPEYILATYEQAAVAIRGMGSGLSRPWIGLTNTEEGLTVFGQLYHDGEPYAV